ncbi:MAG: TrkH family potassium uptake protein [Thermodesulfobacteriota bacterium]
MSFIQWNKLRKNPTRLLVGGFVATALAGGVVLSLPFSSSGARVSFIDALFTATSAVCVTGLTVCDTGTTFSAFGQTAILLLIQLGGLGITTLSTALFLLFGQRTSLSAGEVVESNFLARPRGKLKTLLLQIFIWTVAIEAVGALTLLPAELARLPVLQAVWSASFHAVSAFCNAGFSLRPDNLMSARSNPAVILPIAGLIILGGIGFSVITELFDHLKERVRGRSARRLSLHTKTALTTTGLLLLAGTCGFWALESHNLLNGSNLTSRFLISFFASVTPRTAGFNSIDYLQATTATVFVTIVLMLIGGCPGSTAGGIKVTTLAVLFASARARLRGSRRARLFNRGIPQLAVDKAFSVVVLASVFIIAGILLLSTVGFSHLSRINNAGQPVGILFEVVSALCTVGLSTGITPTLTAGGKSILILLMFIGRLGPLTIAVAIARHEPAPAVRLAEEPIMIG